VSHLTNSRDNFSQIRTSSAFLSLCAADGQVPPLSWLSGAARLPPAAPPFCKGAATCWDGRTCLEWSANGV
jgi:hypothetical protein